MFESLLYMYSIITYDSGYEPVRFIPVIIQETALPVLNSSLCNLFRIVYDENLFLKRNTSAVKHIPP